MAKAAATHLMFQGEKAKEAMNFYASIFETLEIKNVERYGASEPGAAGNIKRAEFILCGHHLIFIDSPVKHDFSFTPSISLYVECETEDELNQSFAKLSNGGNILMPLDDYGFSRRFGWCKDRFGVSWQLNLQ